VKSLGRDLLPRRLNGSTYAVAVVVHQRLLRASDQYTIELPNPTTVTAYTMSAMTHIGDKSLIRRATTDAPINAHSTVSTIADFRPWVATHHGRFFVGCSGDSVTPATVVAKVAARA